MRQGEVYINNIPAGTIKETDSGEYIFKYYPEYSTDLSNDPVSLTMPLQEEEYHSTHLFSYFFNLLSEGENRKMQSSILHIDPEDDFGILLATTGIDTIGNVTIKPIHTL